MQVRLQLRNREAGDFGDLFVTALLKHLERKDQTLVFIEQSERILNHFVQLFIEKLLDRHWAAIAQVQDQLVCEIDVAVVTRAGPQRFARNVLCDAKQPGRKLRLFAQSAQAPVRSHKSLLGQ